MRGSGRIAAALLAGLFPGMALACARPGAPRGGPEDRRPPVVVAAEPAPLSRVQDPDARIRLRFSERISERAARGTLDEAVLVSPLTGPVRVNHGGDALDISVGGGLRPGLVYRVTVLPVITDLFGNRMTDPFELVFTTGPEPNENAVAGQVLDRITGRPVQDVTLALLPTNPVPDTTPYLARSGQDGLFFFRYVPEGRHNLVAFVDRNRNFAPDLTEARGERGVRLSVGDTLITDITLLGPDSTPAQLVRTEIADSTALRLVFTDYLEPEEVGQATVSLEGLEGQRTPGVARVLHPQAWAALRDSLAAEADSAAPGEPGRVSRVPLPGMTVSPPGQERGGLPGGLPLPSQELIAVLAGPLEVGSPYRVTVARVVNVNRVPLGGGQDSIVRPPPPAPPSDSLAAPGDSVPPPGLQ